MFSEKNGYRKSAAKMQYSCTDEIRCSNKNEITISKKVADCWREGRRDLKRLLNIPLKTVKNYKFPKKFIEKILLRKNGKNLLCLAELFTA